ncbi:MAG: zf-HC2 domain-containing protein [Acidobacteria bacterium]|jgi:hypothetical protein|nr:zf-HC2 domain-containing protein [Acidobacteriota bacterium]
MLNTNQQNSSCAFAEQIVSYLYGEANSREKTKFEAHLKNCPGCADELAGFGFVRSSVQKWHKEFLQLETPVMEFPLHQSPETIVTVTNKRSWFAELRQLFTLSPTWATAATAFAVLAVCVGLALVGLNFINKTDVAENKDNLPEKSISYPAIEKKTEQPQEINISEETAKQNSPDKISKPFEEKSEIENTPRVAPKNSIAKVLNKTKRAPKNETVAQNSNNLKAVRKVKDINNINKTAVAKNRQVPKLTEFDEVEDNSLRLSDLMAEVENE